MGSLRPKRTRSRRVLLPLLALAACGEPEHRPRQANEPPIAILSTPAEGRVDERLLFDASDSSDTDGSIAEYRFQPGAELETLIVSEPRLSYEYAEPGTYVVVLTVVDDRGATATAIGDITIAP